MWSVLVEERYEWVQSDDASVEQSAHTVHPVHHGLITRLQRTVVSLNPLQHLRQHTRPFGWIPGCMMMWLQTP